MKACTDSARPSPACTHPTAPDRSEAPARRAWQGDAGRSGPTGEAMTDATWAREKLARLVAHLVRLIRQGRVL